MAKRPQLTAQKRDLSGRKVKQLRRQGLIPANVFGKKTASLSVQVKVADFCKLFETAGETTLIDLLIDNEKGPRAVLIANTQIHPVTSSFLHVDFHQVTLTEKVTANIPLELIGESSAVKEFGGIVVNPISELEIEALPTDLPDKFELDLTKLISIGDTITIADLTYDKAKITLSVDPETVLVTIQEPKEEVEEAPPAEAEAEAEAETPAETEAKPGDESKASEPTSESKPDPGSKESKSE